MGGGWGGRGREVVVPHGRSQIIEKALDPRQTKLFLEFHFGNFNVFMGGKCKCQSNNMEIVAIT